MNLQKILKEFRLIAAVGLLLIPITLLGWLFVMQSSKDIAFAERELKGLEYLGAVVPIHSKLAHGEKTIQPSSLLAFAKSRTAFDGEMNLKAEADALDNVLRSPNVSRKTKIEVSKNLITAIADKSNLILDPDLDTYYLMDVTAARLPDVMSIGSELAELANDKNSFTTFEANRQQVNLAKQSLTNNFLAIKLALNKAAQNTATGKLSAVLIDASQRNREFGLKIANQTSAFGELQFDMGMQSKLVQLTTEQWNAVAEDLKQLLETRVSHFKSQFFYAMGISIFVTIVALLLAMTVLRKLLARLDDRIVYLAHHDPMTQLKNRAAFTAEMSAALEQADRSGEVLALHVIDCDNFKSINDGYGHPAGDAVLQHLSKCLLKFTRKDDIVGRLGGDEFVILQRNISTETDADQLANRIVKAMRTAIPFGQTAISASVSIGMALYPRHAGDFAELMTCSDVTLYAAKAAGRNRAMIFTRDLETEITKRRELEVEVAGALADDRLYLHFQPQFNSSGRTLRGFEALLRLKSRTGEIIPPSVFIPIAENIGLINELGKWVLNTATAVACKWPATINLAVNLSPLQFKSGSISKTVAEALLKSGLAPQRLQVEITEGILLEESVTVFDELQLLREMGVSIAMDDFGTGFSSLSYLWRFRFDKIKIDRSFMLALDNDRESAENILRTIVMLGHSMKMEVTAEGVETSQQAELMTRLKCDEIQGFLYGRPLPEQDLAAVILKSFQRGQEPPPLPSHTIEALLA
jgi:diguanylate cyclase (GGDEF)-like protein